MAAKPPKPPGNFLKSLLNQHNNNKNQQKQQQNNEDDNNKESNSSKQHPTTATSSTIETNHFDSNIIAKNNCNCSNISIMHLFHEMKQEFPTLPDTIVAQCVNENCHQRENCIQMLKHELELNPVPAQSYPAKVLHPPNNNNLQNSTNHNNTITTAAATTTTSTTSSNQKPPLQQKPLVVQQKPPLKPIKPIRTAPLQPPNQQQSNSNNNYTKINSTLTKNTPITANKPLGGGEDLVNNDNVCGGIAGGFVESNDITTKIAPAQSKQSISTTATTTTTSSEGCNGDKICFGVSNESIEKNLPRQRPTTLNLNTQLQKQHQLQRQRLNIQLHQRFQEQRNRQQQQQQPQNPTTIIKPLRKAPLPPIAPKPSQFLTNHTNTNAVNSFLINDSLLTNHTTTSPLSESEISVSVSLSTPSPTSSISPNTTTHHPFNKPTQTLTTNQQHLQTKSPVRHRSVITLQPEPPYTRDFLCTPASLSYAPSSSSPSLAAHSTSKQTAATNSSSSANSSPTASVTGSQKSFTSVNLTLRPPVSPNGQNSALQPSTIDITAGPGFSGASGGGNSLHYSSTSYDARLGYKQNFQITVTDECGVFTASRIRPQQQQQQRCLNQVNIKNENQYDGSSDKEIKTNHNNFINSFLNSQQQQQQQQQLQLQQQQQFHNNNVVALQQHIQNSIQSPGYGGSGTSAYLGGNMCVPPRQAMDAPSQEILQRQKKKRDKLAAALREYKKRLGNVEQEINLLTGTIPTEGLSERLDEEIDKLRRDCQDMIRSSNTFTQQEPQPFPRPPQRPPPPRQTSLDILQHHSQTSTPHTPPATSLPNLNMYNSQQQPNQTYFSSTSPHNYDQQLSTPLNSNFNNNNDLYVDHSNFNDEPYLPPGDADDEYEEVLESWECNMCTFRNHGQLNICETCENVRIIPGRLTNLSYPALASSDDCTNTTVAATATNVSHTLGVLRGPTTSNNAINNSSSRNGLNAANANLEHDTNLVQQQLQHFALHT